MPEPELTTDAWGVSHPTTQLERIAMKIHGTPRVDANGWTAAPPPPAQVEEDDPVPSVQGMRPNPAQGASGGGTPVPTKAPTVAERMRQLARMIPPPSH